MPLLAAAGREAAVVAPDSLPAPYAVVEEAITDMFEDAQVAGLPVETLASIVQEGLAKAVEPETLLRALRAEEGRLRFAREIFLRYLPGRPEAVDREAYEAVTLALQSGMSRASLEDLAGAAVDAEALGLALRAVSQIRRIAGADEVELSRLGRVMLESNLDPRSYAAIASVIIRSMVSPRGTGGAVERAARIVEAGGGLVQITRELESRSDR